MRIQLEVPKQRAEQIKSLMDRAGFKTYSELFNNAVTLTEWTMRQVAAGNAIVAFDETSDRMRELSMPFFQVVAPARPEPKEKTDQQGEEEAVASLSKTLQARG